MLQSPVDDADGKLSVAAQLGTDAARKQIAFWRALTARRSALLQMLVETELVKTTRKSYEHLAMRIWCISKAVGAHVGLEPMGFKRERKKNPGVDDFRLSVFSARLLSGN